MIKYRVCSLFTVSFSPPCAFQNEDIDTQRFLFSLTSISVKLTKYPGTVPTFTHHVLDAQINLNPYFTAQAAEALSSNVTCLRAHASWGSQ